MRNIIFAIICSLLLFTACSANSREDAIRDQEAVKLYLAMNHDVTYTEKSFSADDAIADLVKSECPQGVGDSFVRTTIDSRASVLIIYSDKTGKNITCSVLKPKEQKEIVLKSATEAPDNETAVVVNDQKITIAQIQGAMAALPESTPRDMNTVNLVVNRLINDELLRQEASAVIVMEKEIAEMRASILLQANTTEEALQKNPDVQMAAFEQSVKEQAQLKKLLDEKLLLKDIAVSEEDAREYYLANPNQFLQSEQAMMRMILVSSNGRTIAQGNARAQEIIAKLNTTDFCALVQEYSDDAARKDQCGVYIVPRGVIDPNLELAAFTTPQNQTSLVTTASGIYFVQSLRVVPTQVLPYTQIADDLQSSLRNALFQQRLNLYLATLRQEGTIVSYLG